MAELHLLVSICKACSFTATVTLLHDHEVQLGVEASPTAEDEEFVAFHQWAASSAMFHLGRMGELKCVYIHCGSLLELSIIVTSIASCLNRRTDVPSRSESGFGWAVQ